jgi:hypothetical protein
MTPRIPTLLVVLACSALAVAGCGGNPSAPTTSARPIGSQSSAPRLGVSIAPSNGPPPAASGSAGAPGAPGASGVPGAPGASSVGTLPTPAGNTGLGSLPEGFPLPAGTTLGRIAVRSTDISAPLEVPDGNVAAAFWKKQLPAAGYKIGSAKVRQAIGDIKFTGNGCKPGSDLQISGEHVAFLCRR